MIESVDNLSLARDALATSGVTVADFFPIHAETCQALASGEWPSEIAQRLDVFGDSPLLVRSSSSGTLICANRKHEETIVAIQIFLRNAAAATSLTVMKLPGARHGHSFYPHISGIASSFNPFAWNEYIDSRAGVTRLVFGLGSRLDDRSGDDFSRVVPLNAPFRRPETDFEEICRYSQRTMDYLDMDKGRVDSGYFVDVTKYATDIPLHLFISEGESPYLITGTRPTALTFDPILRNTDFISKLQTCLGALEKSFGRPVEIEFSFDFTAGRNFSITLTACRTLSDLPSEPIDPKRIFLKAQGAVVGQSRTLPVNHIVYVTPQYGQLPLRDRYEIARVIGNILKTLDDHILLLGPGRWGTSSPELGIPALFPEISRASAIGEIAAMRENLTPEVSMGAHIFNELVATDTLYFAVFPDRKDQFVNADLFTTLPNQLSQRAPEAKSWDAIIRVMDLEHARLRADVLKKEVRGWITPSNDGNIS